MRCLTRRLHPPPRPAGCASLRPKRLRPSAFFRQPQPALKASFSHAGDAKANKRRDSSGDVADRIAQASGRINGQVGNEGDSGSGLYDSVGGLTFGQTGYPFVSYFGICQGARQLESGQWFERGHHAVFNPGTSKPLAVSLWFSRYASGTLFSKGGEYQLVVGGGKAVLRVATNTGGGSWDKVAEASYGSSSGSAPAWSHVLFWIVPGVEIGVCLDGGTPGTEALAPGQAARVVGGEVRIGYPPPPPPSSSWNYSSSSYHPGSSWWLAAPMEMSEPSPYTGLVDEIAVFNAALDSGWRAMLWNGGYGNFWHAGPQTWAMCGWWSSSWNDSSSWHYPSSHHPSSSWPMRGGGESMAKSSSKPVTEELLGRSLSEVPEQVLCQYVWGARSGHRDELILRDRDSGGGGVLDERLYCVMDYFDPVAVVDVEGNVVERYGWTAFGRREVMGPDWSPRAGSEFGWSFGFHGQFLDVETGYYNYGYRYYVPWLGRWPNRDPIGEEGGWNLYGFVENNEIKEVDIFGLNNLQINKIQDDEREERIDQVQIMVRYQGKISKDRKCCMEATLVEW